MRESNTEGVNYGMSGPIKMVDVHTKALKNHMVASLSTTIYYFNLQHIAMGETFNFALAI